MLTWHPELEGADELLAGLSVATRTLGFVNAPALMQRVVMRCGETAVDVGEYARKRDILYPTNPGSVYHMTKSMDQLLFQFYAKNDRLRITDLHQGIVWGTQTDETRLDERLINRFDYDGDYGTVLNRFIMQAAVEYPMTVHGTGGQTRAFIHISDTCRCIELAIENPPARGDRVAR